MAVTVESVPTAEPHNRDTCALAYVLGGNQDLAFNCMNDGILTFDLTECLKI
ncbi:MAG: hypothetical protein U9N82_10050 [Thermodesulfobacteriota bacterium]|nr:hypothetical protein [Thermodesulfobacteriota bacterium]